MELHPPFVGNLLLIRGIPGSGKTTFAELISSGIPSRHLEADQFFMLSGQYRFNPARLHSAHQWCQSEVEWEMQRNRELIIVSNTFTQNKEMKPYVDLAKTYHYRYTVVTVESGHDLSGLAGRNVHDVPLEKLQIMTDRWENFRD